MSDNNHRLIEQAGVSNTLNQAVVSEDAWIDVIHKMDEVYADLVHHQLELEAKNTELEETQRFIRSILASMNDVLIVCDQLGTIQQVNSSLLSLTGFKESTLLGEPITHVFVASSHAAVRNLIQKPVSDCEVSLKDFNGQSLVLSMNSSPRVDYEGRLQGMVLLGRPVGELRQAYDALQQAHVDLQRTQNQLVHSEKMASLGRLVAGVAHELNNPISFVFGNMHALKRYSDRISQYLAAVESGGERESLARLRAELKIDRILNDMGSLIDGTLEGAERVSDIVQDLRRYSGPQKESVTRFDIVSLIETCVQWVLKAERKGPKVNIHLPESLEINSRKGHLQQILVNLIQNATDVMQEQVAACIDIDYKIGNDQLLLNVRDHGPGVSQDCLPKIFEPFFTTKEVGQGTGLGLSISYGLAQSIGGELKVDNHPDGGAIFSLKLPLNQDPKDG